MRTLLLRFNSINRFLVLVIFLSGILMGCGLANTSGNFPTVVDTQSPTATSILLPDLVIKSISVISETDEDCPSADQLYNTRVQIVNNGKNIAGPFVIRLNLDQQLINKSIQPGEAIDVIFPNYVPHIQAHVDSTSLVIEQNEANNQLIQDLSLPTASPLCLATSTPEIVLEEAAVVLEGHSAKIWDVQFSTDGKILGSGSVDDTLRLWKVEPPYLVRTMEGHPFPILKLEFTPSSSMIYTGSTDGIVRAWDVSTGRLTKNLEGHTGWITALAISGDGKWLASAAEDATIRLWRIPDIAAVQIIDEGFTGVSSLAFTPDSSAIAWGEVDGTIRVRTLKGDWRFTKKSSHQPLTSLVFSHDGKLLITGYSDGFIRIWNAEDGSPLQTIFAHNDAVTDLAVSEDGEWLVSSSEDHTLRLWKYEIDRFAMLPRRIFTGHSDVVTSVALSENPRLIASASGDGTIRLWNYP